MISNQAPLAHPITHTRFPLPSNHRSSISGMTTKTGYSNMHILKTSQRGLSSNLRMTEMVLNRLHGGMLPLSYPTYITEFNDLANITNSSSAVFGSGCMLFSPAAFNISQTGSMVQSCPEKSSRSCKYMHTVLSMVGSQPAHKSTRE